MKKIKKYIISLLLCLSFTMNILSMQMLVEGYHLGKSAALFHVSLVYNWMIYGSAFTGNQIAGDFVEENVISDGAIKVQLDKDGKEILNVNDGKNTPLVIGSIPRSVEHIKKLRNVFPYANNEGIGIYSLNRDFERKWAGLSQLANEDQKIKLFKYPTTDFNAPEFVDILRIIRDLDKRDDDNLLVSYVQCKAGRGRSAVAICAYLVHLLKKLNIIVKPQQVESYLQSRRGQVKLNPKQIVALTHFQRNLDAAGSFESLYELHKEDVEKRDRSLGL